MIERRIRLVFDAMRECEVACLLMGGQACVLYGAAEFSKDVDFVILADPDNLARVGAAMDRLEAHVIAVPEFNHSVLELGLAVHFRCLAPGVKNFRVDLMSRMRGVDDFPALWARRNQIDDGCGGSINVLGVRDLVAAKKTQRDKDWPMIQRLMEVQFLSADRTPPDDEIQFWFQELRTPELLIDAAGRFPDVAAEQRKLRPLLAEAIEGDADALRDALAEEMRVVKELDREYWKPLKEKLTELRRTKKRLEE